MGLDNRHLRHLAGATVVGTGVLILLGIYTAAVGAGLACGARWPLCDGWMGLFPANWPSFVEWFHRLVALVVGFMILGTWAASWRRGAPHRALVALTLGVALVPVQIYLGAETVLSYETLYLIAHFGTALVIFTAILTGVVWSVGWSGVSTDRLSRWFAVVAGLTVAMIILTPGFVAVHSPELQLGYYGIGLVVFAALIVAALSPEGSPSLTAVSAAGAGLVAVQLVAGRLVRTDLVTAIDWLAGGLLLAALALALWLAGRAGRPGHRATAGVSR